MLKMVGYAFALISVLFQACKNTREKSGVANSGAVYRLVPNWPQLPKGFVLGNPSGIGIDTNQNPVVFYRGRRTWPALWPMPSSPIKQNTIIVLDRQSGKIIKSWGAGIFVMPHGLTVDRQNNVWVTDCGLQQVLKFNSNGKLLMRVGTANEPGNDSVHFNRPTNVAVADDGSFYVSDGYRNSRVAKFSAQGKFLFQWGAKGSSAGQFNIPHGVVLDEKDHVLVADRENSRIEVFDTTGKFLKEWKNENFGKMYALVFNRGNNTITAVDYITSFAIPKGSDVIILDTAGNIVNRFGRSGGYNGPVCRYHTVAVDDDANIYTGDILNNTIQKFERVSP
ncbi:MAG TPA: peptidyl-alpha-hydroxyglycine alpha-amidating lyase family protein [Chitinophagaceae bacterium]|nr:peptidyl-alpha-hydroxyglycine alpha-amidating lyase family protein [Chitinophagaceae bacterium]